VKNEARAPLDIMLKLPSSALNSISCARGTMPDASMFCTASTMHHTRQWINMKFVPYLQGRDKGREVLTSCVEWHADLCNNATSTSLAVPSQTIKGKEDLSWKTYLGWSITRIRLVAQHLVAKGYARRQAAFRIGRLALINLCLLCGVKLHLELVAQYVEPALGLQIKQHRQTRII
jgi:hypothetical protein